MSVGQTAHLPCLWNVKADIDLQRFFWELNVLWSYDDIHVSFSYPCHQAIHAAEINPGYILESGTATVYNLEEKNETANQNIFHILIFCLFSLTT